MPVHADRFQSHGTTDQEAIPMEHLVAGMNGSQISAYVD